nr:hypothetical protein [Alistipes sp. AF48-12]
MPVVSSTSPTSIAISLMILSSARFFPAIVAISEAMPQAAQIPKKP